MIRGRLEEDDPLQAEATFITLWNQGLEITEIAQRLGIPKGTVVKTTHASANGAARRRRRPRAK
jgi:DNA-directed RNA polymerase specialized sigma24 family protein